MSVMASVPAQPVPGAAVSMSELRANAQPRASPTDWSWVLSGGKAADNLRSCAEAECAVLVTGHADGSVSLWDTAAEVPAHLCSVNGGCARPITALALDCDAGLLAVGHEWGQVRAPLRVTHSRLRRGDVTRAACRSICTSGAKSSVTSTWR